ncbi:MAG: hypothetical protein H6Q26_3377 [Bacteroidetes bacterium]|nr:hypothetical protein [Bacteroidota bacterium]
MTLEIAFAAGKGDFANGEVIKFFLIVLSCCYT